MSMILCARARARRDQQAKLLASIWIRARGSHTLTDAFVLPTATGVVWMYRSTVLLRHLRELGIETGVCWKPGMQWKAAAGEDYSTHPAESACLLCLILIS